jgi:hypothetical protein
LLDAGVIEVEGKFSMLEKVVCDGKNKGQHKQS